MHDVQYHRLTGGLAAGRVGPEASSRPGRVIPLVYLWTMRLIGVLPVLGLFALFIYTGLRGVDFGYHWDEQDWHIAPGRLMVQTGILLPKSYIYPSFDKYLVLIPAAMPGLRAAIDTHGEPLAIQAAMLQAFDAPGYLLRVRAVFIGVSALAILWTYGAAIALRFRRWEAFIAACGIGLSWEYAYHARWAVADCILVQFTALTLFMLALFHRTGKSFWLSAASAAAGLGMGTKYPGLILLFGVLVVGVLTLPLSAYQAQLRRGVKLGLIASAVYLCTTPGMLLEPIAFMTDTRWMSNYYAKAHHAGYTMESGWDHARGVLEYFGFSLFSGYQWIAVPMFLMTLVGCVLWVKRDFRFAAFVVGIPCLFLLMFCSKYKVMIVRNYLFLMPCLAIAMARTAGDIARWLPKPALRWLYGAGLLVMLGFQVDFLISAAESIRHYDPDQYVREALDYVARHSNTKFRVSRNVRASADTQKLTLPKNVVADSAPGAEVVFFGIAEGPGGWDFKTNDAFLTKAVFGPREVNFNWYASWSGQDHLVVMTIEKARATGVALAR